MNKWKKLILLLAGYVLVVAACFFSWSYGFRDGIKAGGLTSSMAEMMLVNQHMTDQFANANCEGVEQAINDYLSVLERHKGKDDILVPDTVYYGDLMLSHMRLSRIEEHLGNTTERAKHISIAQEACANRKWKDCSEEKLIDVEKRFEKNNPIACLSNDENAQQQNRGDRE